ncbi:MAG: leucine-rich repeat protein, partial [Clostridia bacterium]|nr:leucine-rich repeat protein [Clostridia bacterium]
MKKKILIFAVMIIAIMSVFVISASAAEQSYTTFEVTLTDGTTKTAYSAGSDKYEGRIYINAKLYAEAPKDSDGTYEEIDWSTVKEIDFSKSMVYFYENDTWKEMAYGLNQSNTALCVMPNGVTVANLFTSLEKVITGKIVVVRGKSFNGCPKLKEIVFSNGIKEIQYNAFDFNTALTTLDFSACTTLTSIGQQAFKGCTSLVNVTLPNTVTSMGTSVFENCTALKTINWPTSMTKIPGSTFSGCSMLAAFAISSNITEIGSSAFKTCTSLTSVYIPASVTSIGSDCWRGCSGVTSIEFHPDCSVQKIFPHTFDSTKVTQIKLPNTVTSIAQSSFAISTLESVWLGKSFVDFNAGNAGQPPFSSGNTLKYVYLPS